MFCMVKIMCVFRVATPVRTSYGGDWTLHPFSYKHI